MGAATDRQGDAAQAEDQRLFWRLTVEQTGGEQAGGEGLWLGTDDDDLAAEAVQILDESRVWVTFLPSATAAALDASASLSWWCGDEAPRRSREAVTHQLAERSGEPPSSLYHASAQYVSFVLEQADGLDAPTGPIAALQACEGRLSLGYLDADGGFAETAFALGGAAAAIAEVAAVVRR
ncbi:hypothetical protein [Halochromatium roseum]|uniref:hypothetical protein n=1 Tax=Halochromatium roseum TaxID=391920 RepID=UPI0019121003|nr:hypothetical protein [Halochromatium roseum]MBK5942022.1 hypothetical protein [Halochromatium roseum]